MLKERSRLLTVLRNPDAPNRVLARLRGCSPATIIKYRSLIAILGLTVEQLDEMTDSQVLIWLRGPKANTGERLEPDWEWVLLLLQKGRSRLHIYNKFDSVRQGGVISALALGHRQAALVVMCRG